MKSKCLTHIGYLSFYTKTYKWSFLFLIITFKNQLSFLNQKVNTEFYKSIKKGDFKGLRRQSKVSHCPRATLYPTIFYYIKRFKNRIIFPKILFWKFPENLSECSEIGSLINLVTGSLSGNINVVAQDYSRASYSRS